MTHHYHNELPCWLGSFRCLNYFTLVACSGAEVDLKMMMATGLLEKNLVPPRLTPHPAGVQTAGHASLPLTAPPEVALETATLTGSSQAALLTDMVKIELAALLTEAPPKLMRRTVGAERPLNLLLSVSLVVLTATALSEHPAVKAAGTGGQGSPAHLHLLTAQPQDLPQNGAA